MSLEIEAVYENGVFKPDQVLHLAEGQRVKLTIQKQSGRAKASAGIFPWRGDCKDIEDLLGPENLTANIDACSTDFIGRESPDGLP